MVWWRISQWRVSIPSIHHLHTPIPHHTIPLFSFFLSFFLSFTHAPAARAGTRPSSAHPSIHPTQSQSLLFTPTFTNLHPHIYIISIKTHVPAARAGTRPSSGPAASTGPPRPAHPACTGSVIRVGVVVQARACLCKCVSYIATHIRPPVAGPSTQRPPPRTHLHGGDEGGHGRRVHEVEAQQVVDAHRLELLWCEGCM